MDSKTHKTSAGLTLITSVSACAHSVSLCACIAVGPYFENKKNAGISHFIEHLLFQGNRTYASYKEFKEACNERGIYVEGWTRKQYTLYTFRGPKAQLSKMLEIFAAFICTPLFRLDDIDFEKKIIADEIASNKADFEQKQTVRANKKLFGNSSLVNEAEGSKSSIQKLTRQQITAYYNKHYAPANMVLSIVGNFPRESTIKNIEKLFNNKTGSKISYSATPPKIKNFRRYTYKEKDSSRAKLIWSFIARNQSLNDDVLNWIIEDLIQRKVDNEVRQQLGLAYSIRTSRTRLSSFDVIDITIIFDKKNTKKIIGVMKGALESISLTNDEIEGAKTRFYSSLSFIYDNPKELAEYLAVGKLFNPHEELSSIEQEMKIAREARDITKRMKEISDPSHSVLVIFMPGK
jgi:predicted Zn-dependent peptidase